MEITEFNDGIYEGKKYALLWITESRLQQHRTYARSIGYDRSMRESIFDRGHLSDGHWKHVVWPNISDPNELAMVIAAATELYGCNAQQCRAVKFEDGSFGFEAVYGAEDDGAYWLEDWDGSVVFGPNRRDLARRFPAGADLVLATDDVFAEVVVVGHGPANIAVMDDDGVKYRIRWHAVERYLG